MATYVLQTRPEDAEFDLVYLQDKHFHISYITPHVWDALHFDTRKHAERFIKTYKMDATLWEVIKIKAG
jgi:hypothetical protein